MVIGNFLVCEKCGKKLIERQENGLFHFVFGRKKDGDGILRNFCPVEMKIHGSVQMRCLARDCGHWNTFNYFPQSEPTERTESVLKRELLK